MQAQIKDLDGYLEGAKISSQGYSLHLLSGYLASGIMCDAPYKLSLVKRGLERHLDIAAIGFTVESSSMDVVQIQGKDNNLGLLPFNPKEVLPAQWERKLLRAAVYLAEDLGFKEVTLPRAEDLNYYNRPHGIDKSDSVKMKEHQERMKLRYDVTAKRMKMKFDRDRGLYVAKIAA